jgi:hypothetical protein
MYANPRGTTLAVLAVLLVSGCSSKNPDALTGLNVDENLAIMDANGSSNVNAEATSVSETNAAPRGDADNRSGRSVDATAATANEQGKLNNQERSAEINVVGTSSGSPPDQEGPNQDENQQEPPSAN